MATEGREQRLGDSPGLPVLKFRKKPVVIEAMQWTGMESYANFDHWMDSNCLAVGPEGQEQLSIPTLEGDMLASRGDWIIRGVAGEFYPCKPDIFEATYEGAD